MSEVIASAGSKKNMLIFSLSEFENVKTFDIRKFYTDNDGNLQPTRKGITLSGGSFEVLTKVLGEQSDKIRKWLGSKDSFLDGVVEHHDREKKYAEKARYESQKFVVEETKWKSPEFFKVTGEGGRDRLELNNEHPFVVEMLSLLKSLEEKDDIDEVRAISESIKTLLELLLLSFGKARHLYDSGDLSPASIIFDSTMVNWGIYLKQYMNSIDKQTS